MNTNKVTRFEVINHSSVGEFGRVFGVWDENIQVSLSMQDDDRTLKVFINDNPKK